MRYERPAGIKIPKDRRYTDTEVIPEEREVILIPVCLSQ